MLPEADRPEVRYLRDLEMARLLERLRERGAAVTLVLDCCHSGGATRGTVRDGVRGARVRGVLAPGESDAERRAAPAGELAATWRRLEGARRFRDFRPGGLWAGRDHVFLAACRSTERALEYPFGGGRSRGVLSYFLLEALRDEPIDALSYRRLYERLLERIHGRFPEQTPWLDGVADRLFLGLARAPAEPSRPGPPGPPGLLRLEAFDPASDPRASFACVLALENRDPGSRLRGALQLAVGRLPRDASPNGPLFGIPLDGIDELRTGEWAVLGLRNRSSAELCLALFDLRPDGSVARILPPSGSGPFLHLEAWSEERVALEASLPAGLEHGRDTLKAFATREPTDFRGLELGPLGGPEAALPQRAATALAADATAAWPDWTSASVEVRVRAR